MSIDIFIRTYNKDLGWLSYCLRSIHKNLTGFRNIIVCIPENQLEDIKPMNLTYEKVMTCPVYENDYLGQQLTKIKSYKYTDADFIAFFDSDNAVIEKMDLSECFFQGKPYLLRHNYNSVPVGHFWKPVTERFLGWEVEHEYMRGWPLIYNRKTLMRFNYFFPKVEEYCLSAKMNEKSDFAHLNCYCDFSEFNAIGAYMDKYERRFYRIHTVDISDIIPARYKVISHWSWGGFTEEVMRNYERYGLLN